MMPLLKTTRLEARYGDFQALFGIDFEIHPGEVVAMIGANGAGKSTFLRTVCGLLKADRNAVEFEVDILWDSEKWTICTEVWVDSDNNQELLSSFGERYAMTLDECLTQLRAATSDLSTAVNKL